MSGTFDIHFSYESVPTLARFAASDTFFRGIVGPIGSGKSSACVAEFVRRGLQQRPGPDGIRRSRFAAIRQTYGQLRDTTMKTVEQWLPERHFGRLHVTDHRFVIRAFEKTEIEILFRALDKPDDVKNLLSLELTGGWVNEAREVPWVIMEALQGRVGRYPAMREGGPTWFGVWADTNPPDVDSRWYSFFEEGSWRGDFEQLKRDGFLPVSMRPEDYAMMFRQPGGLTPKAENLPNLPGGQLYYARLASGKGADWKKVYIDAEYGYVQDGKPVYSEYNDRVHCTLEAEPVEGLTVYRGFDFGLTPACVFSQITPTGRWVVFSEMTSDSMGIDRFSDEVLEHCARSFPRGAQFRDIGDPAGQARGQTDERTCFEILQAKGIDIEPGEQTLAMRLESVRKPLRTLVAGEPQLLIHPRCKMLRKGFQGAYNFRRMQISSERYTAVPDKNAYSHPHDALQYVGTRLFGAGLVTPMGAEDDAFFAERGDDLAAQATRSTVTGY